MWGLAASPAPTHPSRQEASFGHPLPLVDYFADWLTTAVVATSASNSLCCPAPIWSLLHFLSYIVPDNPVEPCIRYLLPEDPIPSKERYIGSPGSCLRDLVKMHFLPVVLIFPNLHVLVPPVNLWSKIFPGILSHKRTIEPWLQCDIVRMYLYVSIYNYICMNRDILGRAVW